MKSKVMLFLAAGLVLFLLGGLVMNQMVQAQYQKMKPYPMAGPCNRIEWDFDSGWVNSPEYQAVHNLGGNPDEYFVYVTARWTDKSVNNHLKFVGCTSTWVWAIGEPGYANDVRIRILKNQ